MKHALLAAALSVGACEIDVNHDIEADITHRLDFGACAETCSSVRLELEAAGIEYKETEEGIIIVPEWRAIFNCEPSEEVK